MEKREISLLDKIVSKTKLWEIGLYITNTPNGFLESIDEGYCAFHENIFQFFFSTRHVSNYDFVHKVVIKYDRGKMVQDR